MGSSSEVEACLQSPLLADYFPSRWAASGRSVPGVTAVVVGLIERK